ncbi:CRISPR-associated endonuclease Cas1 [Spirosoma sordidisoli]|uniref:CRISPR-associated endonuclease Cas1 n=1 Tax=Spirosoma sordidisoli TaxID=2502893 RepID=A0A4Q2UT88_9BACT|nr:CRISPR-associated endonuclease Cas1 [Spirosoma sordidisoli]RYC70039.1 hypothetical protein EQG79_09215 [Spirosoma sordidisoli]
MQLLLDTRGLVMKLRNRCFLIRHEQTERLISPRKISSIAVTQGCMLSAGAIRLAAQHQIPIYFFDQTGDVQASLQSPRFGTIATLRRKQVYFSIAQWLPWQFWKCLRLKRGSRLRCCGT